MLPIFPSRAPLASLLLQTSSALQSSSPRCATTAGATAAGLLQPPSCCSRWCSCWTRCASRPGEGAPAAVGCANPAAVGCANPAAVGCANPSAAGQHAKQEPALSDCMHTYVWLACLPAFKAAASLPSMRHLSPHQESPPAVPIQRLPTGLNLSSFPSTPGCRASLAEAYPFYGVRRGPSWPLRAH